MREEIKDVFKALGYLVAVSSLCVIVLAIGVTGTIVRLIFGKDSKEIQFFKDMLDEAVITVYRLHRWAFGEFEAKQLLISKGCFRWLHMIEKRKI